MNEHRGLVTHAADVQMNLLRWGHTDVGHRYHCEVVKLAFDGLMSEGLVADAVIPTNRFPEEYYSQVGSVLFDDVCSGEVYAVTEEIVDVLEQAFPSVPMFDLTEHDIPSKAGFVWLERPIVFKDIRGKNLVVRAFGWHVALRSDDPATRMYQAAANLADEELADKALVTVAWTTPDDPRDEYHHDWLEAEAAGHIIDMRPPGNLVSLVSGLINLRDEPSEINPQDTQFTLFTLAFFRFINEPWVDARRIDPDRACNRRTGRVYKRDPQLQVVRLRRRASTSQNDGDGGTIEYQHRWLVRGHWRMQPWGPGKTLRRPTWIAEHIKGPEDKPLIVKDKLFSVDR